MNDRFKFRAWDSLDKKMINENDVIGKEDNFMPCILFNGEFSVFELGGSCNGQDPEKIFKIMQCTGLKDKNGKLIYEGDILRVFADPEDYGGYNGHDYVEAVEWWEDTVGFGLSEGHGLDEGWNLEVIGNIHENKELLR